MAHANVPRVGDLLVEAGVITQAQLGEALRLQARSGGRIGTNLVELGYIDEKTLAQVLAKQLSIPSATAAQIDRAAPAALKLIPGQVAEKLRAIPIREDSGKLWVAMAEPTDQVAVDELQRYSKRPIRTMVAPELLIQYGLEKFYGIKRRARFVEVQTAERDLLNLQHAPVAAPVYDPIPVEVDDLDQVSGFLDDAAPADSRVQAKPRVTIPELITILGASTTDEMVFDATMNFLSQDMRRMAVLLIKQGNLIGWRAKGMDQRVLASLRLGVDELPAVARVLASGDTFVGRMPPNALGKLAGPLGIYAEVLGMLMPVRIGKRAVGCIIGVDANLEAMRRKPEMDKVALKLDQALHINYLRRQLAEP